MLVKNRIKKPLIKEVMLRASRVEILFDDGTATDYYAPTAYRPDDELEEYFVRVRNKFLDGRDRHEAQGSKGYKADTPWEAQGELLDATSYMAVLYWDLEKVRDDVKALKKEKGL